VPQDVITQRGHSGEYIKKAHQEGIVEKDPRLSGDQPGDKKRCHAAECGKRFAADADRHERSAQP